MWHNMTPLAHAVSGPNAAMWCMPHAQVKGLSDTFAEPEGAPMSWRNDMRYSGLNIGVMGIYYEPLQRLG